MAALSLSDVKRDVRGFVRNPVVKSRTDKVPAAILLWVGMLALVTYKRGRLDKAGVQGVIERDGMALAVATLVVILSASIAPDLVTWALLAGLVVLILQDADSVARLVNEGTSRLQEAFA